MAGIFKAYDIRGVYPDELDDDLARKIGVAIGNFLDHGEIVVGRDMREVALPTSEALIEGLRATGQDVLDIGLCSTPMNYNAIGHFGADGGVMVTASHNPPEYIGFKISRHEARPVSYETGINQIEEDIETDRLPESDRSGGYREEDFIDEYARQMLEYAEDLAPLKVAVDAGNGMGGLEAPAVYGKLPLEVTEMYYELDGTFPHHTPNPIEPENLRDLQEEVRSGDYDLGVAFDADADRVGFVDERGEIIASDMITALLSDPLLKRNPGDAVVYDLRSSRSVPEEIRQNGGEPIRYRVGHAYMKAKMREHDAVFGGELSGHYYFRQNYYTDCGMIASLFLFNHLSQTGKPLSEMIEPLRRYAQSGEINFEVDDKQRIMEQLADKYDDAEVDWLDGVTVQFDDWWFNVRPSNTEPVLRLNLEADTPDLMEERVQEVRRLIESHVST